MNKVLQRAMFNTPKHEHQSTGIASGLEYRPGYKVGGRVGYHGGGPLGHDHPHNGTGTSPNFNPNLGMGSLDLDNIMKVSQAQADQFKVDPVDYSQFDIDRSGYAIDYSKYQPSMSGAVGEAAGMTISEPIPEGQSQWAKFIGNLSQTSAKFKETRDSLDLMAEQDANKMAMLDAEEARDLKMKSIESIQASGIANADLAASYYGMNVDAFLKDKQIQAEADKGKDPKTYNIDRMMQIVEENVKGAPNFADLPEAAQNEMIRFAKMDEMQNNEMTRSISKYNEMYMQEYKLDPSSPLLTPTELEEKRLGLIQYLEGLHPGIDWNLIFAEAPMDTGTEQLISSIQAFNPELTDDAKEIISKNSTDILFATYITLMQKKQDGDKFVKTHAGASVNIDEAIAETKLQIEMRYSGLSLGG